ncbi:helix-turn-helix domain-containing protein [Geodermatophilus sp. DSM 44513]|uniref:helix-turn-helix domain-containing protein n=1 Tax=Geodermatophilus sp. DSM 44513 TaxID=1528104 RepID=UPI0012733F31|nr:helix-turn-helix domain-containing protein [Geodermatophilus sp. DSM 44513]WNV74122.1 helix-turn-helix domain-containing protein [Geodermatophilus sp. DSM 44513]
MVLLTTRQAADRIGVSVRHVQRLISGGDLVAVGTDRIDAESVAQWVAQRQGSRLRAWEEPTAWAAVALLEGGSAPWLGQAQRSRLRAALAGTTGGDLAVRARNRAEVRRYHAHPRAMAHLAREVVASGATQGVGGLTPAPDRCDGYVDHAAVDRLVRRYRLDVDPAGTVTLRATGMSIAVVADLAAGARHVLAGLDLAGSTDPRERSAGRRLLDRALGVLRG